MSCAYAFLVLYEGADDAERAAPLLADALGEAWEVEGWRIDAIGPCLIRALGAQAAPVPARVLGRFECVAGEECSSEAQRLLLCHAQRSPGFIDAATVPVRLSLPLGPAPTERPAADRGRRILSTADCAADAPSCPASPATSSPRSRTHGPWMPSHRSPTLPRR